MARTIKNEATKKAADSIKKTAEKTVDVTVEKAATAKKRKEEKRAAGDPIYDAIEALIDDRLQTIEVIYSKVRKVQTSVTKAKVIARLNKLVSEGKICKKELQIDKSVKMAYTLPEEEEEEFDE